MDRPEGTGGHPPGLSPSRREAITALREQMDAAAAPHQPDGGPLEGGEGSALSEKPRGVAAACERIVRLAGVRERSSHELFERLVCEGFAEEAVQGALARMVSCGIVDDMRFAEVLVRSRLNAGRGRAGIERELCRHGIDPLCVQGWQGPCAPDDAAEIERALGLLRRKPPTAKNRRDGAYRRLCTKGFSASVSATAARIWSEGGGCGEGGWAILPVLQGPPPPVCRLHLCAVRAYGEVSENFNAHDAPFRMKRYYRRL